MEIIIPLFAIIMLMIGLGKYFEALNERAELKKRHEEISVKFVAHVEQTVDAFERLRVGMLAFGDAAAHTASAFDDFHKTWEDQHPMLTSV